jgi:hypothetical protein
MQPIHFIGYISYRSIAGRSNEVYVFSLNHLFLVVGLNLLLIVSHEVKPKSSAVIQLVWN